MIYEEKPGPLRWIEREEEVTGHTGMHKVRVLQQRWDRRPVQVERHMTVTAADYSQEWRDVPLETETHTGGHSDG